MAIIVQTNVPSLVAQANLNSSTNSMNTAMERMSTGYKINSAKDDAAGLFIATRLGTGINGSRVAQDNVAMANNLLQTTEGDLTVIQENLSRIRDLALTASTEIYDSSSLDAIAKEVQARADEIDRLALSTQFNNIKLFDGSKESLAIQVASDSDSKLNSISIENVFGKATTSALGNDTLSLSYTDIIVKKSDGTTETKHITKTASAFANSELARAFIDNIDAALNDISSRRTELGSYQNRFNSVSSSLTTKIENYSSAKSAIMDADIAQESSNYINKQILQQASSSLLAAANQAPNIALSLI